MKKYIASIALLLMVFLSLPTFSQNEKEPAPLGLPGDNLDLYAVLDLFQKSKTIEAFETSLNQEKTGINNLDLDLDKKVDFIKVVTKQNGSAFQFILQVAVSEKETQDVAVILVDKDKNGKVTLQIVGDKALYGPNYIVEPGKSSVTANPAYTGAEPVKESTPATTTTVVVEQVPVVQYVYSPAYVPYYPPYHYGYYPPYFAFATVIAVGIYRSNHYYHHHGGYYHNTTVIHNENNFNNYNGNRNTSDRVSHNASNGRYNEGGRGEGNRGSSSNRPTAGTSDRGSAGGASGSNRPSAGTSDRGAGGASGANRPSTMESNRSSGGASAGSMESGRTRSGGGGGGYSGGGGGYGGGGGGGGMSRGGGGGGGGRRR